MGKINILPVHVYNRIAAGEVVERPHSVVKELVENAIDAGATEIEIYVEQGGVELIRVIDNGCGIERDDLQSAFLPHATSKIARAEDLATVLTLGFRGEAVASIASVSKMTITSKVAGAKCYRLTSEGGEMGTITEVTGAKGTEVSVEKLFYNMPVRLDYLKSYKAEEADITTFVSRFILNRPDIAFTYYVNGKKTLQSFGGGDEEALVNVYGAAILRDCYKIDAEKHGIRIRGYIGNQNFSKPNKSYQHVFLNGRYIQNATVSAAISGAYASYLMKRQYPFCVLHITMPCEIVDVNVHPNKTDVRFVSNQMVYGCIYSIISNVLDGNSSALEYVVREDKTGQSALPVVEKSSDLEQKREEVKKSLSQSILEMSEMRADEENGKEKESSVFNLSAFSYEEARREVEENKPKIVIRASSEDDVANEDNEESGDDSKPMKGVTPLDQIGDYVPYEFPSYPRARPRLEGAPIRRKRQKDPEGLHRQYPDLPFTRTVFRWDETTGGGEKGADTVDYFAENKRFLAEEEARARQNRIDVSTCSYAGKLFNTYVLYESNETVYIIDQHAAHERLIFDRLKEQMRTRSILRQSMIVPYELKLNAFEAAFIRDKLNEIRDIGFDIREDGDTSFKVYGIPMDLRCIDLGRFFNGILGDISGYRAIKLEEILKDKLASEACKAAVKGGRDLTLEEVDALLLQMNGDMGLKCPHGRPVVVKMTKTQLEKMFKRIV